MSDSPSMLPYTDAQRREAADWFVIIRAENDPKADSIQAWLRWMDQDEGNRAAFDAVGRAWHVAPDSGARELPTPAELLEDDYDGEYRYVGRPLPALKSLDRAGRVLYSGTFSKVLYPALRLAYLIVPASEVERFEEVNQIWGSGSPQLTQRIVTAFMKEGHFSRHIQRMRKLYGERREAATAGLTSVLGKQVSVDPQPGGMHLILRLKGQRSDRRLVARMLEEGLYGEALSDWTDRTDEAPAVLVNFTNIGSQRAAEALARRILKLMA